MDVEFLYNSHTASYLRSRGGAPEIDRLTGNQVAASAVVVMDTESTFLRDQYIRVRVLGSGVATIYQGGNAIRALWHKAGSTDPLSFTDASGKTIGLMPGLQWFILNPELPSVH
jgi:hypothetical protein